MNIIYLAVIPVVIVLIFFIPLLFRVVVDTNEVHIVQRQDHTVSYGKDQSNGNVYYSWPTWVPRIGVRTTRLPVSIFNIRLSDYAAYDKDRLPFVIDIIGFFRVENSNTAAQRVKGFEDLVDQLKGILMGAIRSILASSEIHEILQGRKEFGDRFTEEVNVQLKEWGVTTVKNIELMDIRDHEDSQVIMNIMAMKKSEVEAKSRVEVAINRQKAQEAEIASNQVVKIREQEAIQAINLRSVEQERQTFIAKEQASQTVADEKRVTTEKTMAVQQVNDVRKAEIAKAVAVVAAEQAKQVDVVKAEGTKQQTVLIAEANLEAKKREAEGSLEIGKSKAESERLLLMAPVSSQIELAKEIGGNSSYQQYLVTVRGIERDEKIGVAQAEALVEAEVKIIANTGKPAEGAKSVLELFTPQGATQLGAAVEAFAQTPTGEKILGRMNGVDKAN